MVKETDRKITYFLLLYICHEDKDLELPTSSVTTISYTEEIENTIRLKTRLLKFVIKLIQ